MRVSGSDYTVRYLISFVSNVIGWVHAGRHESKQQALTQICNPFVGGLPAALRQLKSIGRMVLKSLRPLMVNARQCADTVYAIPM